MKSVLYSDRTPLESINTRLFQDIDEIKSFIQNLLHSGIQLVEIIRITDDNTFKLCKEILEEDYIISEHQRLVILIPEKIKSELFMQTIEFLKSYNKNNCLIMVDFLTSQYLLTYRKDIPILQKNLEWGIQLDVSHPKHMKIVKDIDDIFPLDYLFINSRNSTRFYNSIKTQLALFQKYDISAKKLLFCSNSEGFAIPNYLLLLDYQWLDGFRFSSFQNISIDKFIKATCNNNYTIKDTLKTDIIQANELLFKHFEMIARDE